MICRRFFLFRFWFFGFIVGLSDLFAFIEVIGSKSSRNTILLTKSSSVFPSFSLPYSYFIYLCPHIIPFVLIMSHSSKVEARATSIKLPKISKVDLRSFSIDFEYDFTADHDRKIIADNGWSIYLGRGLDIFEPYPKFTMGCAAQENRRCRAFSVTYTNQ